MYRERRNKERRERRKEPSNKSSKVSDNKVKNLVLHAQDLERCSVVEKVLPSSMHVEKDSKVQIMLGGCGLAGAPELKCRIEELRAWVI